MERIEKGIIFNDFYVIALFMSLRGTPKLLKVQH